MHNGFGQKLKMHQGLTGMLQNFAGPFYVLLWVSMQKFIGKFFPYVTWPPFPSYKIGLLVLNGFGQKLKMHQDLTGMLRNFADPLYVLLWVSMQKFIGKFFTSVTWPRVPS